MCNDIFVPFPKYNKVLHIWDERYIPVITNSNDKIPKDEVNLDPSLIYNKAS